MCVPCASLSASTYFNNKQSAVKAWEWFEALSVSIVSENNITEMSVICAYALLRRLPLKKFSPNTENKMYKFTNQDIRNVWGKFITNTHTTLSRIAHLGIMMAKTGCGWLKLYSSNYSTPIISYISKPKPSRVLDMVRKGTENNFQ